MALNNAWYIGEGGGENPLSPLGIQIAKQGSFPAKRCQCSIFIDTLENIAENLFAVGTQIISSNIAACSFLQRSANHCFFMVMRSINQVEWRLPY